LPGFRNTRLSKRHLLILLAILVIGSIAAGEIGTLSRQYSRLQSATFGAALALIPQHGHHPSLEDERQNLDNYISFTMPGEDIQSFFFDCDTDHDRRVDDPATIAFPDGWMRTRFLEEYARCGMVGGIVTTNFVWVYTKGKVSTYLTKPLGLKPYTIPVLKSAEIPSWSVALVLDTGLFPDDETCVHLTPKSCSLLWQIVPLFEGLDLPRDQLFLVPFLDNRTVHRHSLTCGMFLLDSIEQAGCQDYQENSLTTATTHAVNLLKISKPSSLWVLILVTDNLDDINSIHNNLSAEKNVCPYYVIVNSTWSPPKNQDYTCGKDYVLANMDNLRSVILSVLNSMQPRSDP